MKRTTSLKEVSISLPRTSFGDKALTFEVSDPLASESMSKKNNARRRGSMAATTRQREPDVSLLQLRRTNSAHVAGSRDKVLAQPNPVRRGMFPRAVANLADRRSGTAPKNSVALAARSHKVDILASYSPGMLIQRFADNSMPPTAPSETTFAGAVVFVDVSGFTALSEALSKDHGPTVGAELLNLYINSYMRKLIESIEKAGGDIIKFAGDAMQVIWRNANGNTPEVETPAVGGVGNPAQEASSEARTAAQRDVLAKAVLAAARCSLRMLTELHGFSPKTGVTLKLHIGIGAGEMTAYTVGGHLKKWCACARAEGVPCPAAAPRVAPSAGLFGPLRARRGRAQGILHRGRAHRADGQRGRPGNLG